jgi:glycine/serine hydroxymethyltransferase
MSKRKDKLIEITPANIRRLVKEERQRLNETLELGASHPSDVMKKVKEVQATQYADTLAKCMNYYQACKIKEAKLVEELKKIQEAKRELKRQILKGI